MPYSKFFRPRNAVAEPVDKSLPIRFELKHSNQLGAFLGRKNFEYGIDRYVVIYPDGRGYAWHELNDCGEKLYDGSAKDQSCPKRVE